MKVQLPVSMTLHIFSGHQNAVGWQLVVLYMQSSPNPLLSSGRVLSWKLILISKLVHNKQVCIFFNLHVLWKKLHEYTSAWSSRVWRITAPTQLLHSVIDDETHMFHVAAGKLMQRCTELSSSSSLGPGVLDKNQSHPHTASPIACKALVRRLVNFRAQGPAHESRLVGLQSAPWVLTRTQCLKRNWTPPLHT